MTIAVNTTNHTVECNGRTFNYRETTKGVAITIPKGTNVSMENYISAKHKLDRTHYDTPASVMGCPCKSCNESRKRNGKKTINGFDHQTIRNHGIIDGTDMTIVQLELAVEKELEIKY